MCIFYPRRLLWIDSVNDTIARSCSKCTHEQCLRSTVEPCALGLEDGVIFGETENDANDYRDADGDKQSVVDIFHNEVWDHRKEATLKENKI